MARESLKISTTDLVVPDYSNKLMKIVYLSFSTLLLIYLLWPGPSKISDFEPLPNSLKSTLSGDTTEIPNVTGYFSNNYRNFIIPFYIKKYQRNSNFPFPPLRLNHPPEYSWTVIKKHTDSTYLEELVYPLRDSLYINGIEPFYEDGTPKFWGSTQFDQGGNFWYTKATLRFYPSSIPIRLIVWLGLSLSILFLFKLGKKIILHG